MPLFFFNILGGRDIFDDTGTHLDDTCEIRIRMIATAYSVIEAENATEGYWELEVLDERGRIVASMDFSLEAKRA